jgi:Domain of unknown function (DUF4190)
MAELTPIIAESPPSAAPEKSPAAEWSIASAASLACGIFVIVPFFAGLAAIGLGILGIRQINQSNLKMRGRQLAMAGVVLGLLNILGWFAYFKFIGAISGPGRSVTHHFIDDLNSADSSAAGRECLGNIRPDRLTAASNQIKNWGGVKNVAVLFVTNETVNGTTTGLVRGTLRTPTGDRAFQLQTASDDDSNWKIREFSLQ